MSSFFRTHLATTHPEEWVKECQVKGLEIRGQWAFLLTGKPDANAVPTSGGVVTEPFSKDGFLTRLIKWLVSDDQV